MYFLLTKDGFLVYNGNKLKYQREKVCRILYGTTFGRFFRTKMKSSSGDGQTKELFREKLLTKKDKGVLFCRKIKCLKKCISRGTGNLKSVGSFCC